MVAVMFILSIFSEVQSITLKLIKHICIPLAKQSMRCWFVKTQNKAQIFHKCKSMGVFKLRSLLHKIQCISAHQSFLIIMIKKVYNKL